MLALVVSGPPDKWAWTTALLVVGAVAGLSRPPAIGSIRVSVSGIVQIAAIPLVGPVGAALVAAVPGLVRRSSPVKDLFNTAQRVLLVLAGAAAYSLVGGAQLTSSPSTNAWVLWLHMMVGALVAALANTVLLAGVLQLSSAGSLRVITADLLRQVIPDYASYLVAGYLLTILWAPAGLGWMSIFFFLPSLLVIQWGLHQHASEWATRHDMLTPFVEALDIRRPGAAEEARLASGAAHAVATGLGLSPALVDRIATAARLRDVGMLALDGAAPAIVRRDHSLAAREVVGSVTFLRATLDLVDGHHERVDGQGHPLGLVGGEIPLGARVLAVADTWAHLRAEGWSPRDAVDHCEAVVGQSLDESCVAGLRRALERDQLPQVTS